MLLATVANLRLGDAAVNKVDVCILHEARARQDGTQVMHEGEHLRTFRWRCRIRNYGTMCVSFHLGMAAARVSGRGRSRSALLLLLTTP